MSETRLEIGRAPPGQTPKALPLVAKLIKATLVIDPTQLVGVEVPNGLSQVSFVVTAAGRRVKGRLNAKTLRRAIGVVTACAGKGVAVIIQGRLAAGDQLEDAGIAAQPKGHSNNADNNASTA
jgi:hypothetical protein